MRCNALYNGGQLWGKPAAAIKLRLEKGISRELLAGKVLITANCVNELVGSKTFRISGVYRDGVNIIGNDSLIEMPSLRVLSCDDEYKVFVGSQELARTSQELGVDGALLQATPLAASNGLRALNIEACLNFNFLLDPEWERMFLLWAAGQGPMPEVKTLPWGEAKKHLFALPGMKPIPFTTVQDVAVTGQLTLEEHYSRRFARFIYNNGKVALFAIDNEKAFHWLDDIKPDETFDIETLKAMLGKDPKVTAYTFCKRVDKTGDVFLGVIGGIRVWVAGLKKDKLKLKPDKLYTFKVAREPAIGAQEYISITCYRGPKVLKRKYVARGTAGITVGGGLQEKILLVRPK